MSGRVSIGGQEMELQEALDEFNARLEAATAVNLRPVIDTLNATLRGAAEEGQGRPTFELVGTIDPFDGERPEAITRFFENLEDVGELSNWGADERLKVAKLKITGAALRFIKAGDQALIGTYENLKTTLLERFSDKSPRECYFQQLSVISQRRGETIESFADRVRSLNEKTIRVTANPEVNAALREEGDRRALEAFQRGLVGRVGEETRMKFPQTLQGAVTTALSIEYILRPKVEAAQPVEKKVFMTTDRPNCPNCADERTEQRAPLGHAVSNFRPVRDSPNSPMRCWRCDQVGHLRRDCRVRLPDQRAPNRGNDRFARRNPSGNENRSSVNAAAGPR